MVGRSKRKRESWRQEGDFVGGISDSGRTANFQQLRLTWVPLYLTETTGTVCLGSKAVDDKFDDTAESIDGFRVSCRESRSPSGFWIARLGRDLKCPRPVITQLVTDFRRSDTLFHLP